MAKKNISRILTAGAGIGVLLAVIVPVLVYVLFVVIPSEDNIDNGLLTIPFVCNSVQDCLDKGVVKGEPILDPEPPNPIKEILDPTPTNITEVKPVITCKENEEFVDGTCVIIPPPKPEPVSMEIISTVLKTDSDGTVTESKTNKEIPVLLSFFVEDTSNKDFSNGFLEQKFEIKTKADLDVTGSAKFNIFIDGIKLLSEPINLSINGKTNFDGKLIMKFNPSLSIMSDSYVFSLKINEEKFKTNGITPVEFVLSDIMIDANEQRFNLGNATLFSMNIARDPNQILIKDETGGNIRVYPIDDKLYVYSTTTYQSYSYCFSRTFYSCISYATASYCTQAPAMGGGKVTHFKSDGTSEVINSFPATLAGATNPNNAQTGCSSVPKVDLTIQRNEVYQVEFDSPVGKIKFKTPFEQKNIQFNCQWTGNAIGTAGVKTAGVYCNYNDPTWLANNVILVD